MSADTFVAGTGCKSCPQTVYNTATSSTSEYYVTKESISFAGATGNGVLYYDYMYLGPNQPSEGGFQPLFVMSSVSSTWP
jgi:hypothetical protein